MYIRIYTKFLCFIKENWLTDINSEKLDVMKTLANYSTQLHELLERFEQFNNYQRQVKVYRVYYKQLLNGQWPYILKDRDP